MSVLRTIRKLLFGETWLLPGGLAVALAVTILARELAGDSWRHAGGFVLLAAVAGVLALSVARSGRPR